MLDDNWHTLLGRPPTPAEIAHETSLGAGAGTFRAHRLLMSPEGRERLRHWRQQAPDGLDANLAGRRVAFVHIEKCGGTMLHAMLHPHFAAAHICPERFDGLGEYTLHEFSRYDLFSGYFALDYCHAIPGEVRIVTLLREPRARLLSLYAFWRAHRACPATDAHPLIPLARRLTAEAFFAHPEVTNSGNIRDVMCGTLLRTGKAREMHPAHPMIVDPHGSLRTAWHRLAGIAAFGLLEYMEGSRQVVGAALGLDLRPTAPRQVLRDLVATDPNFVPAEPIAPTPLLLERLDALTPLDRALYRRARRLFARRLALSRFTRARRQRR